MTSHVAVVFVHYLNLLQPYVAVPVGVTEPIEHLTSKTEFIRTYTGTAGPGTHFFLNFLLFF
jgi:hypothetical protein